MSPLLLVALLAAQTTEDGDKAKAAALVNEGNALYEKANYREALSRYEEAYRAYASPKILFNIAEAHNELGQAYPAAVHYDRFLSEANIEPGSDIAGKVAERKRALQPKLAYLAIGGEPAGAKITIDGVDAGELPIAPIYVEPGRHAVGAELEGHTSQNLSVTAVAGQTTPVTVHLEPPAPETPALTAAPAITATAEPPAAEPSVTEQWWFWTAIGAAVAGGVIVAIAAGSGGGDFLPMGELGSSSTAEWTKN